MNKHLIAIAATAIAVTGCATQTTVPAATEDLNVGIAKTCTPSVVDLSASTTAKATIAMTNDGWCGLHVKDRSGAPFKYGLVKRPARGYILVQKIGGETRIEYTAENRYVGPDAFSVTLISNTPNTPDSTIQVTTSTTMGENMTPPPAAAPPARSTPAPRAPARTPARTTSPTR